MMELKREIWQQLKTSQNIPGAQFVIYVSGFHKIQSLQKKRLQEHLRGKVVPVLN
jgi:hypothetical protein